MVKNSDALQVYLSRVFAPQGYFLAIFLGALILSALIRAVLGWLILSTAVMAGIGYLAYLADLKTFRAVPTFFPSKDAHALMSGIAIVSGCLVTFLAIAVSLTGSGAALIIVALVALKLLIPSVFAFAASEEFREHVFPLLLKHENDREAFDAEMARKVEEVAERKRADAARERAVHDARMKVLTYFTANRQQLSEGFDEAWVYAACQAEIPDSASPAQAYSAAASLLAKLQQHGVQVRKELRDRRSHNDEIDAKIERLRTEMRRLPTNPIFAQEPATQKEELARLERQISELESQKHR